MASPNEAPQSKPLRVGAAMVLLAGLVAIIWWICSRLEPGPAHEGKPVAEWVGDLLSANAAQRSRAEAALRAVGTNAVPYLIETISRRDSPLRASVLKLQGKMPAVLWRPLYRLIRPYEAEYYRQSAARAIEVLGPQAQAAIPALAYALRDGQPRVVQEAASALAALGRPAVPALAKALAEGSQHAKLCACSALSRMGPDALEAVPALLDVLLRHDRPVEEMASQALVRIGPSSMPALLARLESQDEEVSERVERVLASAASASYEGLTNLCREASHPSTAIRSGVIRALSRIEHPTRRTLVVLTNALSDESHAVRLTAANALGGLAGRIPSVTNALPVLRQRLQDEAETVRQAASEAIERITASKAQ